jgi:hypothetical protein
VSLRNHVIFFRMLHSFINRLDSASVASLRVGSSTNRTTKALHRTGCGAADSVVPSARGSSANGAVWRPEAVRALEIHRLCTREGNTLRLYYPTTTHTTAHSALLLATALHTDAASAFRCRFNRRRIFGSNAAGRSPNVFVTINS